MTHKFNHNFTYRLLPSGKIVDHTEAAKNKGRAQVRIQICPRCCDEGYWAMVAELDHGPQFCYKCGQELAPEGATES